MSQVKKSIVIKADKARVFEAYVTQINLWWPKQGSYQYTFAAQGQLPASLSFEEGLNGRFLETYSDGSTYEIGRITLWNPPNQLCYTWRDPRWSFQTKVHVTFSQSNRETTVTVIHSGFPEPHITEMTQGYKLGLSEILLAFAHWEGFIE